MIHLRCLIVIAVAQTLVTFGCNGSNSQPADLDERPAVSTLAQSPVSEVKTAPPAVEAAKDLLEEPAPPTVDSSPEPPLDAEPEVASYPLPPKSTYLLWLPTTSGPLLVGLDIVINDQPLRVAFDEQVDAILSEAADEESVSWEQLFGYVTANPQTFGQAARINESQYRNLTRRFDRNRNDRPEQQEAARFIFRDAGFSNEFRLVGTDAYRGINRSNSVIFQTLDTNQDRQIDIGEMESAEHSLLTLDRNADQRLDLSEVETETQQDDQAWNKRRSTQWGEVAMDLSGYVDWSMFAYTLDELPQQGPFGLPNNAIARLLQTHPTINRDTSRAMSDVFPDLHLEIHFSKQREPSEIKVTWISEALAASTQVQQPTSDCLSVSSSMLRICFRASDLLDNANGTIPEQAFVMLDVNQDGGLDMDEIPEPALQQYPFEELDQDGDGKLTLEEIREGMSSPRSIWNFQVRGRAAEVPDGVFDWLDENEDGFLSTRELRAAPQVLRALSKDNQVTPEDLPDSYRVHLGRCEPNRESDLFSSRLSDPSSVATGFPSWAIAMDSNRDGEISRNEFPGNLGQFDKLDQNRDGFLSPEELGK